MVRLRYSLPKGRQRLIDAGRFSQTLLISTSVLLPVPEKTGMDQPDLIEVGRRPIMHACEMTLSELIHCLSYLSEPAKSTRFNRANRKLIIESHSHCNHSQNSFLPQKCDHFAAFYAQNADHLIQRSSTMYNNLISSSSQIH